MSQNKITKTFRKKRVTRKGVIKKKVIKKRVTKKKVKYNKKINIPTFKKKYIGGALYSLNNLQYEDNDDNFGFSNISNFFSDLPECNCSLPRDTNVKTVFFELYRLHSLTFNKVDGSRGEILFQRVGENPAKKYNVYLSSLAWDFTDIDKVIRQYIAQPILNICNSIFYSNKHPDGKNVENIFRLFLELKSFYYLSGIPCVANNTGIPFRVSEKIDSIQLVDPEVDPELRQKVVNGITLFRQNRTLSGVSNECEELFFLISHLLFSIIPSNTIPLEIFLYEFKQPQLRNIKISQTMRYITLAQTNYKYIDTNANRTYPISPPDFIHIRDAHATKTSYRSVLLDFYWMNIDKYKYLIGLSNGYNRSWHEGRKSFLCGFFSIKRPPGQSTPMPLDIFKKTITRLFCYHEVGTPSMNVCPARQFNNDQYDYGSDEFAVSYLLMDNKGKTGADWNAEPYLKNVYKKTFYVQVEWIHVVGMFTPYLWNDIKITDKMNDNRSMADFILKNSTQVGVDPTTGQPKVLRGDELRYALLCGSPCKYQEGPPIVSNDDIPLYIYKYPNYFLFECKVFGYIAFIYDIIYHIQVNPPPTQTWASITSLMFNLQHDYNQYSSQIINTYNQTNIIEAIKFIIMTTPEVSWSLNTLFNADRRTLYEPNNNRDLTLSNIIAFYQDVTSNNHEILNFISNYLKYIGRLYNRDGTSYVMPGWDMRQWYNYDSVVEILNANPVNGINVLCDSEPNYTFNQYIFENDKRILVSIADNTDPTNWIRIVSRTKTDDAWHDDRIEQKYITSTPTSMTIYGEPFALYNPIGLADIKSIFENGLLLTGGTTRLIIKTDGKYVLKTCDQFEYIGMSIAHMKYKKILSPVAMVTIYGRPYILEKFIQPSDVFDKCAAAGMTSPIYLDTKRKFDEIVKDLKRIDIGGDFKLDNIMFDSEGNMMLDDFVIIKSGEPITYRDWAKSAILETKGRGIDFFTEFDNRLNYYIQTKNKPIVTSNFFLPGP